MTMDERISTGGAALAKADEVAESLRTPAAAYSKRLLDALREIEELEKRSARLANLRSLAFVSAAALAAFTFFGKLPSGGWYAAGAGIAVYAALAVAHERVFQRKRRTQLLAELNERGIARLTGEWHRFKDRGDPFAQSDHLYAGDLDIFGQGSLFQLINETATRLGESVLAQWLALPAPADVVRQRHGAVRELSGAIDFRQTLLLECRLVSLEKADPSPFIGWAEGGPYLKSIGWARPLGWLLPGATLAALVAGQLGFIARYAWLAGILLSVAILRLVRGQLDEFYRRLVVGEMGFTRFERVFEAIAEQRFADPLLQQLSTDLGGERVSLHLRRFARLFGFTEVSPQLHAVFNVLFLWDIHWFFRLETWRIELGGRVRKWFDSLAQLESLSSLAALAHDRPQFTFPDLAPIGPVFIARGLGHPLLDNPVRNDVDIPGPRHALIITGSNMSGKSTLLRAIGTNAVLALTGAPVCAQSLEVSELRVLTSMRVRDSLELGVSHFYAEVQRIKAVLDAASAANGRALFLLDEILWGTNTRERQIASREVLRLLLKTGASGAVSTHDLSLASLEQELGGRVKNFHFKDQLVDGKMTFDYRLRDGVLDTTNALRLLRLMGIAIEEKEPP
jgi:hypothetical protein